MNNSVLDVYDVSPFVYIGDYINSGYQNNVYNFPIKGMLYLLKNLAYDLQRRHDVVLCFDSRSFRKDLARTYKEHRVPNPQVYAQLDFLYTHLTNCGFTCLKENGYEADDLIYNVVEFCKNQYSEINIYGVDYDLVHNVSHNVSFKSISSNVNNVDIRNFAESVVKDEYVEFNSITAYKMFNGDKSDKVPPIVLNGVSGKEMYNKFLEVIKTGLGSKFSREILKKREIMDIFIEGIKSSLSEQDYKMMKTRQEIFYPAVIENFAVSNISHKYNINYKMFIKLLSTIRDDKSLTTLGESSKGTDQNLKADLYERAKKLNTGEYLADNNIVQNCVRMNSESLFVKGF